MKIKVAVIMGGFSSEFTISIASGETVFNALKDSEFEPIKVLILKEEWIAEIDSVQYPISKDDFSFIKDGVKIKFDVVFNAVHGTPGEDGLLQAYFNLIGMKHTSSGFSESALTFNKSKTNTVVSRMGISCPKGIYFTGNDEVIGETLKNQLGFPMFVKPSRSGSSYGITRVNTLEGIPAAVAEAKKEDSDIVVEAAAIGTEVGCGVARINGKVEVLAITEIVSKNDFFDYKAKYEGQSEEITPARISTKLTEEISEITKKVYTKLELSGIARMDYIIEEKSAKPIFIEVNTVPGFSGESIVPKQLAYRGYSHQEFFSLILHETLK